MHPDDAKSAACSAAWRSRSSSRAWRNRRPVETAAATKPPVGLIFVPFFDEGRLVNKLTLDATCPISKETDFKKCAVKVVKALKAQREARVPCSRPRGRRVRVAMAMNDKGATKRTFR